MERKRTISESELNSIISNAIMEATTPVKFERRLGTTPKGNVGPKDENLKYLVLVDGVVSGDKGYKTREAADRYAKRLRDSGKKNVKVLTKKVVEESSSKAFERRLGKMISEAVNEAVKEKNFDRFDSGIEDYQGTGGEESKERVKKIRNKSRKYNDGFEPIFKRSSQNDSTYDRSRKLYGGENAMDTFQVFEKFVKPLRDKIEEVSNSGNREAWNRLYDLYGSFRRAYSEWANKYRGAGNSRKAAEEE